MTKRLLIIPTLMASALFAQQGPDAFADGGGTGTMSATPEQLATVEVYVISAVLRLNNTDTSALLADLACASSAATVTASTPCTLTAEQNVLQSNGASLKTDYTTLVTELSSTPPSSTTTTVAAINGLELSNLQAQVAAVGAVLAELATLKVTLTSTQQTNLLELLVSDSTVISGSTPIGLFHR